MSRSIMNKMLGVSIFGLLAMNVAAAQTIAIMNGKVHTAAGAVIENGDVIIQDGRITQIGADLSAPAGSVVIDASGKVVTPGIFSPYSSIGLVEVSAVADSNDSTPHEGFALGAALDALDAYNPSSSLIAINRTGGITRALSAPGIGDTLFGGRAAVIDMSGKVNSVTKANAAQVAVLGIGAAERNGGTRMGGWAVMREFLDEAQSYHANPNDYVQRPHDGRFAVSDLKALGSVLEGEQPLMVRVDGANDIRNLIKLKDNYGLKVIIVGGAEAWLVADELSAANIPVIVDALYNLPRQFEHLGATLKNAARLNAAGVKISFFNPPGRGAHNLRYLTQMAGNAVSEGLPYDAAIKALTIYPAEMFGLESTLGSLQPNKIADVVIWDGDPLEVTVRPEVVFINGQRQDLSNRQTALRDRYRDLSRGDLPIAYRGGN